MKKNKSESVKYKDIEIVKSGNIYLVGNHENKRSKGRIEFSKGNNMWVFISDFYETFDSQTLLDIADFISKLEVKMDENIIKFYSEDLKIVYRIVKSEWKYILLTEDERKIYKFIRKYKKGVTKQDLVDELDINMQNFYEAINNLIDKGLIEEK